MKYNKVLNNFTSGVWSSRMLANTDLEQYSRSCKTMNNMFVMKQGGAFRRPGTLYKSLPAEQQNLLNANNGVFMIPWSLSNGAKYIIIGDKGNPHARWFVYNAVTGVFSDVIAASAASQTWTSAVTDFHYTQVGDELIITAKGQHNIPPRRIFYFSTGGTPFIMSTVWEYYSTGAQYYKGFPYLDPIAADASRVLTTNGTTGTITITANFSFFTNNMAQQLGFDGACIRFTASGTTGVAEITGYSTSTSVTAVVRKTLPLAGAYGSAAGTSWQISAWNYEYGYPTTVTAHEGRLLYGGMSQPVPGKSDPNVVYASGIGDPYLMMEIPNADSPDFTSYAADNSRPFIFYPASSDGSIVQVLSGAKSLFIGTERNEIVARGVQQALGSNDITLDSSTSFGADIVQPVRADNYNTYVQKDGRTIRDIIYSYENEQYKSVDISFYANDYFIGKNVKQLCSGIINGTTLLFAVLTDGTLVSASLDRELGVTAWNKVEFQSDALVKCMICIPSCNADKSDALYLLMQRTINASTKVYLELLSTVYEKSTYNYTTDNPYVYLDSSLIVTSPGSATISVPHLAAKTVLVIANGEFLGEKTVASNGNLVLDQVYSKILIGLANEVKLVPAPIQVNTQVGNSMGMVKKNSELYIKFWNTLGATYGDPERNEFYNIGFTEAGYISGQPVPFFTGEKRVLFPPGFSREKQIEIKTSLPYPINILAIVINGTAYD